MKPTLSGAIQVLAIIALAYALAALTGLVGL